MTRTGSGTHAGVPRSAACVLTLAVALAVAPAAAVPAAAARDAGFSRSLAEAEALAGGGRFAAAESALRAPVPPGDGAAAGREALRHERAWLRVRGWAPGACDSTWEGRPARLLAAMERAGAKPAEMADAWTDRSRVEYRMGMWPAAVASAREALSRLDRSRAREPLLRYRAHLALAEALAPEDHLAARAALAAADSLARALGPAAAADRARHLRIAGTAALMGGDWGGAVPRLREAVAAAESRTPPDEAEAGLALSHLGHAESDTDPALGETHRTQGRERLVAALGLADERTLQAVGRSIASMRDPALLPALAALADRAEAELRARGLAGAGCAWDVGYFQGRVKNHMRRFDEARAHLHGAIAASRRWGGPDRVREMLANVELGITAWIQRDTASSLVHHRRALEISAKHPVSIVNDPNFPRYYLATAYAAGRRLAEARDEYAAQWEAYRSLYGETNRRASIPAARAARCSRGLGDTAAAETWYARAMRPFLEGAGGSREEFAEVRASWALFLYWRGEERRAFEIALENARLRRTVVDETVPWLAEGDAARFAETRRQDHELLMSLALWSAGAPADVRAAAWTEMALGRGLLLEALLRRARTTGDSAAGGRAGTLRRELAARVLASLRAPASPASQRGLDSLRAEIARVELGGEGGGPAAPEAGLSPGAVARRLAGGALVSWLRVPLYERAGALGDVVWWPREHYLAFVLAPGDSVPRVLDLGAADSMDAAVRDWRAAAFARGPADGARAAGERLRARAWDPVAALLPAAGDVWLVPDGELQKVNFYALPAGPGRWLVEEPLVLHRLVSERDLGAPPERSTPARGLLVLGGVDYERAPAGSAERAADGAKPATATPGAPPACRALLEERFEPLPATGAEVATVVALGRSLEGGTEPVALTGPEAGEAAFKRLAPGRRIVHLATHSFFLGADCAAGGGPSGVVAQNPLVFSGIALAGANRWAAAREAGAAEDGLLTAEELAGLDLRGVEWLVLSGCESGLGQVRAWEGVYGLPRAGRRAGVRAMVMSLAPVDDEAAGMWMRALYEARFARNEGTAAAVRSASRRVLEWLRRRGRAPEPRLWGAFVALGE